MNWFKNLLPSRITASGNKKAVPEGLWSKCDACAAVLYRAELDRNLQVCPHCNHHHPISARMRLQQFLDPDGLQELANEVEAVDRLQFRDSKKYKDRLSAAQKETGEREALIAFRGSLRGLAVVAASFEYRFIGGSMGSAVGERFVRALNVAYEARIPFICFSASGGARMQEGLLSLMQMSKTAAALKRFSHLGLPYISVLTDPTMGGVAASLAMLGDVIVAEPAARVGFAGPRVIEQTVRAVLPEGFQRSEFLLAHGAVDLILDRRELATRLAALLSKLMHLPRIPL